MANQRGYGGSKHFNISVSLLLMACGISTCLSQEGQQENHNRDNPKNRQLLATWFEAATTPPAAPATTKAATFGAAPINNPLTLDSPVYPPSTLSWCVSSDTELATCLTMLVVLNDPALNFTFRCTKRPSERSCLEAVYSGDADIVSVEAGDAFLGFYVWRLKSIVSEVYGPPADGRKDSRTHAVAVVRKELCNAIPKMTFRDLQGRVSCHTGYRMTTGWVMPVGYLVDVGVMNMVNTNDAVPNDIETVQSFFSSSCAPGPYANSRVCSACAGDCSLNDTYHGYPGAMNCLMNGGGDVAFVDLGTVTDYAKGGRLAQSWAKKSVSDFMFLCPDLGCHAIDEDATDCALATVPPHVVMVRKSMVATGVTSAILAASTTEAFKNLFFQGKNSDDSIFRKEAVSLAAIKDEDMFSFLGSRTISAYSAMYDLDATLIQTNIVRLCVQPGPELAKCQALVPILEEINDGLNWDCVTRQTHEQCVAAVRDGDAELVSMEGVEMYTEISTNRMIPLASQNYDPFANTSVTHKAVAVVPSKTCKQEDSTKLRDFQGKASCHGKHRSVSGWDVPVGYMLANGIAKTVNLSPQISNDIESADNFFGKLCAPVENATGQLCSACSGDCNPHKEPYSGDGGAFRGLMEGKCDIAFVKHSTVARFAKGGSEAKSWSTKLASEFKYLCPLGGCASIGAHDSCSFGEVPSASIMAHMKMSEARRRAVRGALAAASRTPAFIELFRNKNPEGYIFDSSMVALNAIDLDPLVFVSPSKALFEAQITANAVTAISASVKPRKHKKKMSVGVIVPIIFGVVGGFGISLGVVLLVLFVSKKRGYVYDGLARNRMRPA